MPLRALRQDVDWLVNRLAPDWDGGSSIADFKPPCDVSETADAFEIRLDVPGLKPDDFEIEVAGDSVRISGRRHEEKEEKGKTFHRVERRTGQFCECMVLPCSVKDEGADAEYQDGILTIKLPKAETARTRNIKVKAKGK
jgi:HSP20 family protein